MQHTNHQVYAIASSPNQIHGCSTEIRRFYVRIRIYFCLRRFSIHHPWKNLFDQINEVAVIIHIFCLENISRNCNYKIGYTRNI